MCAAGQENQGRLNPREQKQMRQHGSGEDREDPSTRGSAQAWRRSSLLPQQHNTAVQCEWCTAWRDMRFVFFQRH